MATLKRLKFAASSEAYSTEQQRLLFETIDTDLEALSEEIGKLNPSVSTPTEPRPPKRTALPEALPCTDIHHEPTSTSCHCGCQMQRIGEDVAEKLDYQPGVFTVQRHVRGKWVCRQCETLVKLQCQPMSSTRVSRQQDCWPMCWWPNIRIIYRCIARAVSLPALAWPSQTLHWRSGWGAVACTCNRWSMPSEKNCWHNRSCMPMKRRSPC